MINYDAVCPHCNSKTMIYGAKSLFRIFKCQYCKCRFRGIHAHPKNLGFPWKYEHATTCPRYCVDSGVFRLIGIKDTKQGDCCDRCGTPLPIQPAIQESKDNWDDDNVQEYWRQKKLEESPEYIAKQEKLEKEEELKLKNQIDSAQKELKRIQQEIELEKESRIQEKAIRRQKKAERKEREQAELEREQAQALEQKQASKIDYLKIAMDTQFMKSSSKEQLEILKQNLLDDFKFSMSDHYRLALNFVEKEIKRRL